VHLTAWSTLWIGVYALDVFAILRALTRGHGVAGTFAWIFAIIALPGVGAGAYLLLANPSIKRTTRRKRLTTFEARHTLPPAGNGRKKEPAEAIPPMASSLLYMSASLTGFPPSAGNHVTLLAENTQAFEVIEQALRAARRSIWAECYVVRSDETGKRFLEILAERAAEGIEVRLLYDAFGSALIDGKQVEAIRARGGRAEAFLPMNPLRRRWSVHLRNHRKLVLVDGEIGFTGSMNVGNEYSGRSRRREASPWRDAHLSIRGPAVGDLAQTFAEDWLFATEENILAPPRPPPAVNSGSVVAVVPSGPDQEHNANSLLHFAGIASARDRCYITSPYFVPDEPTLRAIESTALRGVDLRLLVPQHSDLRIVQRAARSYYGPLLRAGVRIFEYTPSMLHAKTMVVDSSWCMVGSANMDVRSFWLNFEVGAIIFDTAFADVLEQRFAGDLALSNEITALSMANRSFFARVVEGMARLLSPLL
jgi:cardiolipin synthase